MIAAIAGVERLATSNDHRLLWQWFCEHHGAVLLVCTVRLHQQLLSLAAPFRVLTTSFQTRFRKRLAPSTPDSCHSSVMSAGEANIMNRRTVSAPYFVDHLLWVDTVVFRLRHFDHA